MQVAQTATKPQLPQLPGLRWWWLSGVTVLLIGIPSALGVIATIYYYAYDAFGSARAYGARALFYDLAVHTGSWSFVIAITAGAIGVNLIGFALLQRSASIARAGCLLISAAGLGIAIDFVVRALGMPNVLADVSAGVSIPLILLAVSCLFQSKAIGRTATRPRRWLRFGVRTLLVVLVLCQLILCWSRWRLGIAQDRDLFPAQTVNETKF